MKINNLEFKYSTNSNNQYHGDLLNYFNSGEFKKYFGSEQKVSQENIGKNSKKVFSIKISNCGMNELSRIFSPENKFLPHELSCEQEHCYSFIETVLKAQRGDKAKLKRGLIDRFEEKARIKV